MRYHQKLKNIYLTLPMILIMGLTLLLLVYVGFGEAKRQYLPFQLGKLATQGEIIQGAFDAYLQAGLPLKQFSGFAAASEALLGSDPGIENIRITDTHYHPVFLNKQAAMSVDDVQRRRAQRIYHPSKIRLERPVHRLEESPDSFQVSHPLSNKFGVVGYVFVEASRGSLVQYLDQKFRLVFYACGVLTLTFAALVVGHELLGARKTRPLLLKAGFIGTFLAMSGLIWVIVFQVYAFGAQASTKALADSMAKRLSALLELGIGMQDVSGIDQALQDYQDRNPSVSAIALIENDIALSHTDQALVGERYETPKNSLEHIITLPSPHSDRLLKVAVTIPAKVIFHTIKGSAKAFIVLFIACSLISLIFLNAGTAYLQGVAQAHQAADMTQHLTDFIQDILTHGVITPAQKAHLDQVLLQERALSVDEQAALDRVNALIRNGVVKLETQMEVSFEIGLHLIKPAYFLIVFVNALSISFLPQWISEFSRQAGSSLATASLPFTLYYLAFALALIPSGQYAERGDVKKLMGMGFAAELLGLVLLAVSHHYWWLTLGRISSGMGQGIFLIGLQSYVTAVTPRNKRSLGHAVKVTGRNAALIAGSAIGALLVAYMDYQTLFLVSSMITVLAMLYLSRLVPGVEKIVRQTVSAKAKQPGPTAALQHRGNAFCRLWHDIKAVSKDGEFLRTLVLIGVVGKISIAGVVMFGVPLMLSAKGVATEDIGLALMLYYISSLVTTDVAAKVVDRAGLTHWVLTISAVLGGMASIFLGCVGITQVTQTVSLPGLALIEQWAVAFNTILASTGLRDMQVYAMLFFIVLIGISNGLLAAPVMTHINNAEISKRRGLSSVAATYTFMERFGHVIGPAIMTKLLFFTHQSTLAVSLFGGLTIALGICFGFTANLKFPASQATE